MSKLIQINNGFIFGIIVNQYLLLDYEQCIENELT